MEDRLLAQLNPKKCSWSPPAGPSLAAQKSAGALGGQARTTKNEKGR